MRQCGRAAVTVGKRGLGLAGFGLAGLGLGLGSPKGFGGAHRHVAMHGSGHDPHDARESRAREDAERAQERALRVVLGVVDAPCPPAAQIPRSIRVAVLSAAHQLSIRSTLRRQH